MTKLHYWTEEQYQFLKDHVKGRPYKELMEMFNKHFNLSLKITQLQAALTRKGLRNGLDGRIKKGNDPWNKGMKGWTAGGNSYKTRFKKGQMPPQHRPIGSERIDNKDGYVYIKTAEPHKWELKHRKIWQDAGREIPDGHILIFSDGDKTNITLDNLLLVERKDLVRMNQSGWISSDPEATKVGITMAKISNRLGELKS